MSDGGDCLHSCGVTASDGQVKCWGGNRCRSVSDTPTSGTYLLTSVGAFSSCAILLSSATAVCWGCLSCESGWMKGQCSVSICESKYEKCPCSTKGVFVFYERNFHPPFPPSLWMVRSIKPHMNSAVRVESRSRRFDNALSLREQSPLPGLECIHAFIYTP